MNQELRMNAEALQDFTAAVFAATGMPPQDAALEAEVLVWANLRGIDSHGVLRIPWYVQMINNGQMNPTPKVKTLKETPAVLYLDADRALGPIATVPAMVKAIEKAKNVGIGWSLLRNITHQGAMSYYTQMAAHAGLAGMAIVCSPPNMAPFGARAAGLHNSPIAIAVPAGKYRPLSLDMATSIAAGGKLTLAQDKGIPLGEGWALDNHGNPTVDPHAGTILLPAAGPKGSGLALMFQTLTSLMANNPLLTPVLHGESMRHNQNSIVAAIDISLFTELDTFTQQVDETIESLKALPKADGVEEILMPGEYEFNILDERSRHGIPLPPGTQQKLRDAAARFGLPLPAGLDI
jgi:ureidoglycolate dehydrogenase (NAD+)